MSRSNAIAYRRTDVESILQLRHRTLREGHPISEVMFAEDQDQASHHYGAFNSSGVSICCLSLLPSEWNEHPAWRLRAIVTAQKWRNQGIGSELLRGAIASLKNGRELMPIWCHARVSAIGFYENFGWHIVSEPFEYGNAGLSVTMLLDTANKGG